PLDQALEAAFEIAEDAQRYRVVPGKTADPGAEYSHRSLVPCPRIPDANSVDSLRTYGRKRRHRRPDHAHHAGADDQGGAKGTGPTGAPGAHPQAGAAEGPPPDRDRRRGS